MAETKRHRVQVLLLDTAEQRGELLADTAVQVLRRRVRNNGNLQRLGDGRRELGLGNNKGNILLLLLALASGGLNDKLLETLGQTSVLDGSKVLDSRGSGGEALDGLDLEPDRLLASK